MRTQLVALSIAAMALVPALGAAPSPAAASDVVDGRPVEYTGTLADLNARGAAIDWRSADDGGFDVRWRRADDGTVGLYHVPATLCSAGHQVDIRPGGIIWCE